MGLLAELASLKHRISVRSYHRMGEAGVFAPDARVELIEGEIVDMAPIGSEHAGAVRLIEKLLHDAVGDMAVVSVQNPVALGADSEPQLDVALLKRRDDFYRAGHPAAEDVLLLIEVSESSTRYDREVKIPLYAKHGIPEVWLVDLEARLLSIHTKPSGGTYRSVQTTEQPGRITISELEPVSIDLSRLF